MKKEVECEEIYNSGWQSGARQVVVATFRLVPENQVVGATFRLELENQGVGASIQLVLVKTKRL